MKIGAMVESFQAGLDGGLKAAAEVGAQGVQLYATEGQTHPDNLDAAGRKLLLAKVKDLGLEFAALCGDFGGHGFQIAEDNPKRVEDSKKVMDMALDLECSVVTTHIGVVPSDKSHPRYAVMAEPCAQLAEYGKRVGATFAIETGPESSEVLRAFLDDIDAGSGLGVNFDPANLIMVINEDIPQAVRNVGPYIVHTHAKDGRQLKPVDAEKLYEAFAIGGIEGFNFGEFIMEDPLGQGHVPWDAYLDALQEIGFDGYLTIEREVGDNPRGDIELAVSFLKELLAKRA